ncbi:MAG: type IX secretion system sortase PorU [Bacteroidetes bacterium]|nr:type IX secretion system sortase PorU [Bacteroidota bacterium]
MKMGLRYLFIIIVLFLNGPGSSVLQAQQARYTAKAEIIWDDGRPSLATESLKSSTDLRIVKIEGKGHQLFYRVPIGNAGSFNYNLSGLLWKDGEEFTGDLRENVYHKVSTERKRRSAMLLIPLKYEAFARSAYIEEISIEISPVGQSRNLGNSRSFAANSVLATGDWFKFGIESSGIYKLSYSFLKNLGVDVDNISINDLVVYGQQGGMLERLAGAPRVDDLQEIPIKVVASGSQLQDGDYIVFYGEGPESWEYHVTKDRFIHDKHKYSDYKGYFITSDMGPGLRVNTVSPPAGQPAVTFQTFNDHVFLEEDLYNLNKSGSDWIGEEFSLNLQNTFSFSLPALVSSSQSIVDYRVVARSTSGSSSFQVSYEGDVVSSTAIGQVGSQYTAHVANAVVNSFSLNAGGNSIDLTIKFNQPNFAARGWLDYIAINAERQLTFSGNPLAFRNIGAMDHALVGYAVGGINSSTQIWDVSDLFDIKNVNYTLNGSTASFNTNGLDIDEFIAFTTPESEPLAFGQVNNQNLHGLSDADLIILTREALKGPAIELADFHEQADGLTTHVVTLNEIQNEFASGNGDVSAIRDFLKMFYDRSDDYPSYVCILGDGSFNNRDLGEYLMPTFESDVTFNTLTTLVTDDFFGFLDDDEGENVNANSNQLDLAIGRIPADNLSKANVAVEKIKRYYASSRYGNWQNVGTFVTDDEDLNIHIDDGDYIADEFIEENPVMNIEKIYLDAYRQQAGAGGGLYPDVNNAINNRLFKGSLFLNYIGHGGGNGLADERVVTLEDIDSWNNSNEMPLIISATCEFTRYDDFERYSAGERAFFKADGGAIALVTTVRLVFSNKNFEMNKSFMDAFELGLSDPELNLGDIIRIAKNNTPTGEGNRKFTLIGDPALKLAFPRLKVQTTNIEGANYMPGNDTLKALTLVTIDGEVTDNSGILLSDFNGLVYPTVYDKVKTLFTLGNDERSIIRPFNTQNSIIYSGKVQALGGKFSFSFVVPKDIVYAIGPGKISYFAHDDNRDAAGIDTVLIGGGGLLDSNSVDNDRPVVEVFMDDETWISGDFTDESPDLLVNLFDENGINTVGSGVGHDIVAVLDDDTENGIILNDFYESELNSYQYGKILYPLSMIPEGTHDVKVKAWDVFNNSGEGYTEFVIAETAELAIDHILNYPNPFTTSTKFMFEHNRKGDVLDVRIEVFTVSGKLVKTLQETSTSATRRVEIGWDGLDDYGDRIGKGVYIYKVSLKDSDGSKVNEFQKLVLLR